MTKIVFLDRKTIGPTVDLTRPQFPHDWEAFEATTPEQIVERAGDADIIITNKVPLKADTLAQLPKLGMIAVAATGYDIIDIAACAEKGIVVSNVRGYAVNTVPEHALALMLALSRREGRGAPPERIDAARRPGASALTRVGWSGL